MIDEEYSGVRIDFYDRTSGINKPMIVYPVTKIALIDIDTKNSTPENVIKVERIFVVKDGKWTEQN